MAGIPSGGNKLSPNPNVNAPAGTGGDVWGANGGGITPYGNNTPESTALATGQTQTNYSINDNSRGGATESVLSRASGGRLPLSTADSSLPSGGSTLG